MRSARWVTSLCLLAGGALTVVSCKSSAPADNAADPQIRQWISDFTQAFQSKSPDGIAALYAPNVVAYDLIPPLQYDGKDAYMKDWKEFFAGYQGPLSMEVKNCHIASSGNLAYAACLDHMAGTTTKGEKVDTWLRVTSVFSKINGQWLDIHDHVSVPTDLATGKSLMDLKP